MYFTESPGITKETNTEKCMKFANLPTPSAPGSHGHCPSSFQSVSMWQRPYFSLYMSEKVNILIENT